MDTVIEVSPNGTAEKEESAQPVIVIDKIAVETMRVPILGTAPLIVNRFTEKAKRQMLDNMQARDTPKVLKNPEADYEAAFYRLEGGGYGIPSLGFWQATIGAARFYKSLSMTALRQYLLPFPGERGTDGTPLVRIDFVGEPIMREDVVRVGRGTDLRYRPEFTGWSTVLTVSYVKSVLSSQSVLSLIDAGGMSVGVCEWRPEKSGGFGTYRIDPDKAVEFMRP